MAITLLETRDHSHTLYVPELDETYHSRNGAVEEAMYVYIGRGLRDWSLGGGLVGSPKSVDYSQSGSHSISNLHSQISILEIGFGTGLNAWLTALECAQLNIHCTYHSLETFPLNEELITQLNYTGQSNDETKKLFSTLHLADWNIPVTISDHFTLKKEQVPLEEYLPQTTFDVIYFDAFAPEKQPELWTETIFRKLYNCLNPGGIIVTYSSKGAIRRLWKQIGFETERLPGPPMKRHMLRGRKEIRIAD